MSYKVQLEREDFGWLSPDEPSKSTIHNYIELTGLASPDHNTPLRFSTATRSGMQKFLEFVFPDLYFVSMHFNNKGTATFEKLQDTLISLRDVPAKFRFFMSGNGAVATTIFVGFVDKDDAVIGKLKS